MSRTARNGAEQADGAELTDALASFVTAYTRDLAAAAAAEGLTVAQVRGLALLGSPCPMRSLADRLACDASNVTGIIDRLESRDLVRRRPGDRDRRVRNVVTTPAGADAVRRVRGGMHATAGALDTLSAEERETLALLLAKLTPALERAG